MINKISMPPLILKVFHSFIHYSRNYNKRGGSMVNHATYVLIRITFVVQSGLILAFAILTKTGKYIYASKWVFLSISICFLAIDTLFWIHIRKKYLSASIDFSDIKTWLYFWSTIFFVFILYCASLFLPLFLI